MILPIPNSHTPTLIDPKDYPLISRFHWSVRLVGPSKKPYVFALKAGCWLSMHRLIMNPLPGIEVDHKNSNGLDNRRKNLRLCTRSGNTQNARGWSKRRLESLDPVYKGVWRSSHGHTWEAKICYGGKQRFIGTFKQQVEAAQAYDQQARIHHGRFARLNFPNPGEQGVV